MSGPNNLNSPAGFLQPPSCSFTAANGTIAKVLVDQYAAAAAATPALPNYYGGCAVIDLLAQSSDTANKDVLLYIGHVATTQDTTNTGAVTTTASTIVRVNGSWIADGFLVGDQVMMFAPLTLAPNAGVDGIQGTVTSVSALTVTVSSTPFGALTLAAGTRICRMAPRLRYTIALGAGTNGTTPSQGLFGTTQDGSAIRTELKLGANNILACGMQSAVSALPCVVNIAPTVARY